MSIPNRPKLTLNRNHTLVTTKGHVIQFVKDIPTHVPPPVYQDAIAIGAVPEDGTSPDILKEEIEATAPLSIEEREGAITATFAGLIERNARETFTAAGHPHFNAVSELVGFKVGGKEVAAAWQKYNDSKGE